MEEPKKTESETAEIVKEDIPVQGLDCADCAQLLEKAVCKLKGVTGAQADFIKSSLRVEYSPEQVLPGEIIQAVQGAGYAVPAGEINTTTIVVEGMDCADEEKLIRKALGDLSGIEGLDFFLVSGTLRVNYNPALTDTEAVIRAIGRAGFTARVQRLELAVPSWKGGRQIVFLGLCALLAGMGFAISQLDSVLGPVLMHLGAVLGIDLLQLGFSHVLADFLYSAAMIVGGFSTARKALAAAKNLTPDMNLLMTVAVIGAAAIDQWTEAVAVVFLFSLANILENYSLERTRRAIRSLLELSPQEATVKRDEIETTVPVEEVRLGETIIIYPGAKIPLDGEVLEGNSTVNQAPITGESMPVKKGTGDVVFAGSINQRGSLAVRVTHLAGDTTLARIIHMVEEAQAQKAPSQGFVDRFAKYYTPAVIVAAVLVMAIPPLLLGQPFNPWFYRSLVLLVISCPCALVISTPVAIVSGLAGAARTGILIKGGVHLENAGAIRVMAFDKTGTLTRGEPEVTQVVPLSGWTAGEVLGMAAAVERRSEHHLAQAILNRATQEGVSFTKQVEEFEAIPGKGVRARINGKTFYVGSHQLFADLELCREDLCVRAEALENESQTVVVVGSSQGPMGLIVIEDALRPEAPEAMDRLRRVGIEKLVMLTGDNPSAARAVAERLGLDSYIAGLLPADKVGVVKRLLEEGNRVAMVGDGVNDAPALATATLGIAMGAAGSDAAIEAADIALMSDDLAKLPVAISLSRKARRIIKANIILAIAAKTIFLALGAVGLATLWMAVFADMGVSLMVILNGLRAFKV
ncbi:MAG: cadmium-translocating P-type ATPase [Deltaproteobacteria bacterium]|nr:cadmium-translocating P-type ATPase [Deltaproteobacteria bacterium]